MAHHHSLEGTSHPLLLSCSGKSLIVASVGRWVVVGLCMGMVNGVMVVVWLVVVWSYGILGL